MSLANRILLAFLISAVLLIALGAYSVDRIGVVRATTDTIVTRDLAAYRHLDRVRDAQNDLGEIRQTVVIRFLQRSAGHDAGSPDEQIAVWTQQAAATETALSDAEAALSGFVDVAASSERGDSWLKISQALTRAKTLLRQIRIQSDAQFQAIHGNDVNGVLGRESALLASRVEFDRLLSDSEDVLNGGVLAGQRRAADVYEQSRVAIAVALIIAIVIGLIATALIRRSIVRPLAAFMAFVERVGRGDLAGEAAAISRDEIGQLGRTLNGMVEGLRQLARQSREATENLNAATAEIRASTQEQAASVEEQLAAVQETAATVDQITHSGSQIGKRAQEVIAAAQATAQTSTAGLRAVDDTARAMDAIREQGEAVAANIVTLSEKTQAIGEIIATVNDISERSHLLALNAAIEAAAAGESGRSFAVVASEMKTLADQAKEATAQVRSILGDIQRGINASVMLTEEAVKRVAAGKQRTDTTQRTIEEITSSIQESVQTFQQIVASTNQQQLGIEQVMGALQNIRQASQQTAAGTRQLDTAAANLSGLSQQLLTLAERYRV